MMTDSERRKRLKIAQWRATLILRKIAKESGHSLDVVRQYVIDHADIIFR